MTTDAPLDETTLGELDGDVRGDVVRPGDASYDDARGLWNDAIDRRPALVLRCAGVADVVRGLGFADERGLAVSVRGTGHNIAGTAICDGGLVLDLEPMDGVRVDPDARTARVGPGTTWGDLDHESQAFGLATTGAQAPSVGVVGATLGGGTGWLNRKLGLTVDHLRSADVVTADGDLVHASAEAHPDLFWALRGGSGNLGVVTSMELDLHAVGPEVLAGSLIHPIGAAPDLLAHHRDFMADAPRALTTLVSVMALPAAPHIPEAAHGDRAVLVLSCWAGDLDEGEAALQPLRAFGDPIVDTIRRRPYTAWQRAGADDQTGRTHHTSHYFEHLPDAAIETLIDRATDVPSPGCAMYYVAHDGAVNDVAGDATAYPHRDAATQLVIEARWDDPADDDRHVAWARDTFDALAPYATGGVWVNALSDVDDPVRIRAAYGENYGRLAAVKAEWDPGDRFRSTHHVPPADV